MDWNTPIRMNLYLLFSSYSPAPRSETLGTVHLPATIKQKHIIQKEAHDGSLWKKQGR